MPAPLAHQFLFFCAVGVVSTIVDFLVYNLLCRHPIGLSRIKANLLSTTTAMAGSFVMNSLLVFSPGQALLFSRGCKFLLVTLCSLYVVQNVVIYTATTLWKFPTQIVVACARKLKVSKAVSDEFIQRNAVKLFATIASLAWNYIWYKQFVYTN